MKRKCPNLGKIKSKYNQETKAFANKKATPYISANSKNKNQDKDPRSNSRTKARLTSFSKPDNLLKQKPPLTQSCNIRKDENKVTNDQTSRER